MNTTHLITIKHRGLPIFRAVCPRQEGDANHMAGVIIDRLADDTGLTFNYEVRATPYIRDMTPIAEIHEAVAAEFVRSTAKAAPPTTVVITPENSEFHLTARGAHLMAANLLAQLVLAESVLVTAFGEPKGELHSLENGRATDAIQSIRAAIDAAKSVGIRAQSFAERERDLLEANNRYLERARSAEHALEEAKSDSVDLREERDAFARIISRSRSEKPGITPWDLFAAEALRGISGHFAGAGPKEGEGPDEADARFAALRADALLAERAKRGNG